MGAPCPVVSVAWVEAGKVFGFGRKFEGGMWMVRLAAAADGTREAATASAINWVNSMIAGDERL